LILSLQMVAGNKLMIEEFPMAGRPEQNNPVALSVVRHGASVTCKETKTQTLNAGMEKPLGLPQERGAATNVSFLSVMQQHCRISSHLNVTNSKPTSGEKTLAIIYLSEHLPFFVVQNSCLTNKTFFGVQRRSPETIKTKLWYMHT